MSQSKNPVLLGIMSGTSGDGVDVAAVRIRGHGLNMRVEFIDHRQHPFAAPLRKRLLAVMAPAETRTEEIARLHTDLGQTYADAALAMIDRLGRKQRPIAIGLAGQTVCHLPFSRGLKNRALPREPRAASCKPPPVSHSAFHIPHSEWTITLQLGNPHLLAARTGVPVIADFRQSDVAAGGQGAPLVPWTDWVLLRSKTHARAVQNIGGVGNVTFLPAGGGPETVIAFDTGPGNMIIDLLVQHVTNGRQSMDEGGRRAARGRTLLPVLERWLQHPFLKQPPPRTTGRETFGKPFVDAELRYLKRTSRNPDDWIATATEFTAHSIAGAYHRFLPLPDVLFAPHVKHREPLRFPTSLFSRGLKNRERRAVELKEGIRHPKPDAFQIILCGGGARNPALRRMLSDLLHDVQVTPIDDLGIPSQAKEAVSFVVLARAHLDGVPANLPQATGARGPARLGVRVDPPALT